MNWQGRAVCGGARVWLFFGPDGETEPERRIREAKAKAICASCRSRCSAWIMPWSTMCAAASGEASMSASAFASGCAGPVPGQRAPEGTRPAVSAG
jgi:hypothetical protein